MLQLLDFYIACCVVALTVDKCCLFVDIMGVNAKKAEDGQTGEKL